MALSFLGLVLGTLAFGAFAVLDRLLLTGAAFWRVSVLRGGFLLGVLVPAVLVAWRRPGLWQPLPAYLRSVSARSTSVSPTPPAATTARRPAPRGCSRTVLQSHAVSNASDTERAHSHGRRLR